MRSSLRPHPTSPELRTVAVREGPFSMDKSHLKLVAPAEVNRIVAPTRRPNAELRTREHLTPGEVEAAKANRHGHRDATMILLAFRDGLRAAELIALEWSQVDFAAAVLHVRRVKKGTPATHPLRGDEMRALRKLQRDSRSCKATCPAGGGAFSFYLAPPPRGFSLHGALCLQVSQKVCLHKLDVGNVDIGDDREHRKQHHAKQTEAHCQRRLVIRLSVSVSGHDDASLDVCATAAKLVEAGMKKVHVLHYFRASSVGDIAPPDCSAPV
jgi:hypothetical protein